MSILLDLSRIAVVANLGLLLALGYVWIGSYRRHRAAYPLALSVFAGFLFVQNGLWLYLYLVHEHYGNWFTSIGGELQMALMGLCALETAALVFLGWITLR